MKKILSFLLAALLMICLCACAQMQKPTQTTPPADGKTAYTVTVLDQNGAPVVGAVLQLCKDDLCQPNTTNESGIAVWTTAEDSYKVTFIRLPDGYTYVNETIDFYFNDDNKEMTITLINTQN